MINKKENKDVFIIAEIGKNFIVSQSERSQQEYLDHAKKLIDLAVESGVDAVKFQTHNVEDEQAELKIVSPHFNGSDRYSWIKRNTEICSMDFWNEMKEHAEKRNILFFSTPMSREAAKNLEEVGVPMWKVGSGDLLDFVLLDFLAKTRKKIILSTGMSTEDEVGLAVNFLKSRDAEFSLMYCVSKYPSSPEDYNMNFILHMRKKWGVDVGFSDHSLGTDTAVAAVNAGAMIIEKHFTDSREHWGSDHKVSLLPDEFKQMVRAIRAGGKSKNIYNNVDSTFLLEEESQFRPLFRKSLVLSRDVKAGEVISPDMLYAMRPQGILGGLPSETYDEIIGKRIVKNISKYTSLNNSDIE